MRVLLLVLVLASANLLAQTFKSLNEDITYVEKDTTYSLKVRPNVAMFWNSSVEIGDDVYIKNGPNYLCKPVYRFLGNEYTIDLDYGYGVYSITIYCIDLDIASIRLYKIVN